MVAETVQAQYETLEKIAARFGAQSQTQQQMIQNVRQRMDALRHGGWIGKGSTAFFSEMDGEVLPALQRLFDALRQAQVITTQIGATLHAAEDEAARPFRSSVSDSSVMTPDSGVSPLRPIIDTLKGISGVVDKAGNVVLIGATTLLALGLKAGSGYPGQVIVRMPELLKDLGVSGRWLRDLAGVSPYLSHINAANMATHIGTMVKTAIAVDALITTGKGYRGRGCMGATRR